VSVPQGTTSVLGLFIGEDSGVSGKDNYVLRRYQEHTNLVGGKSDQDIQALVRRVYSTDSAAENNPFLVDDSNKIEGHPYDKGLIDKNTQKAMYPFATTNQLKLNDGNTEQADDSTNTLISGDWPVPDQTPRVTGVMLLYYEVVQERSYDKNGNAINGNTYYFYHGLLMDPDPADESKKNKVQEVKAAYDEDGNALANPSGWQLDQTTGLVSTSDHDKYVIDDGYLFVINSNVANDGTEKTESLFDELLTHVQVANQQKNRWNNIATTRPYNLTKYKVGGHTQNLINKLNLDSDYVYDMSFEQQSWNWDYAPLLIGVSDQDISNLKTFDKSNSIYSACFDLDLCPYYGDCFSTPNDDGNPQPFKKLQPVQSLPKIASIRC
jgi:hypothetical protein